MCFVFFTCSCKTVAASIRFPRGKVCQCPNDCVYKDALYTDAELTEKGHAQARAAGASLASRAPAPQVVFVSPLTRTLQTASIALHTIVGFRDLPVIAAEALRERNGVHFADKRSAVEQVKPSFPNIDFSNIATGPDPYYSNTVREKPHELVARSKAFFWSLQHRPEKCIAVFTHSSFLAHTLRDAFVTPHSYGTSCNDSKRFFLLTNMVQLLTNVYCACALLEKCECVCSYSPF